jgi:hypothetical protein
MTWEHESTIAGDIFYHHFRVCYKRWSKVGLGAGMPSLTVYVSGYEHLVAPAIKLASTIALWSVKVVGLRFSISSG